MSPLSLRRYRAERLLQREFDALRARVIGVVRARLAASGTSLDSADLEACYAQAWQGLYTAMIDGEEIANTTGWLVLVTFRRAVDEHRSHTAEQPADERLACEPDLAGDLDDRVRLRQLFEGMCARLDRREREAAALCYLQGFSRAQAASHLGLSEARMRKLMDGRGPGRPGVAGKVGALVLTIRDGGWCQEQGSLMRGLAYGILEPGGERHRLALMHSEDCPSCRAYVASLRGLAAALPPVFPPAGLLASALAHLIEHPHAPSSSGAPLLRAGAQAQRGLGGALPAAGGAGGAGTAAGGGWLLGGGSLAGKFAVGCLITLSVGASCVALEHAARPPHRPVKQIAPASAPAETARTPPASADHAALQGQAAESSRSPAGGRTAAPLLAARRAVREFGPEQSVAAAREATRPTGGEPVARAPASPSATVADASGSGEPERSSAPAQTGAAAATREFAPG
jgi:DNA-directed RNA polymerase specialized sigma24 family protein